MRAHANHLRLAVESDNWDEPHNRTRRKVRYATHDLEESASDEGTDNSEDEVSTIEERSEDDLEEISDNNDRESENENSNNEHTPAGDVDINTDNESEHSFDGEGANILHTAPSGPVNDRPQRRVKLVAKVKMKAMHQVTSWDPGIHNIIQDTVNHSLQNFLQSFTQSFSSALHSSP